MVVQKSEVVAKGNRQFEGSGRWKLIRQLLVSHELTYDGQWKVNETQRMVEVPCNDGKRQAVLRHFWLGSNQTETS